MNVLICHDSTPYLYVGTWFSSPRLSRSISKNIVYSLWNLKFVSEWKIFSFDHLCCFNHKCKFFKISNEDELCRLFTLTFEGTIKIWFEALPTRSIQSWKQFLGLFIIAHQDYDYNELCVELENIWRKEGKLLEDFFSIFNQICYLFLEGDKPFGHKLYKWCLYLLSLTNEQDQLNNGEQVTNFENNLSLEMHVSQETSPSIDFNPGCYFVESTDVIGTIVHQLMLGLCFAHSILDQ